MPVKTTVDKVHRQSTYASRHKLEQIRFYTGVRSRKANRDQYWFWTNKLNHLEEQGIYVYRGRVSNGQEKGTDVSLAIDLIRATYEKRYEVAIIVSKDSDFGPAVEVAKVIALRTPV